MVAGALLAPPAFAGNDTDSFDVTATVLATCEVTAQDLEFGDYDPVAAAHLDAATELSVTCTNGSAYEVGLSLGDGSSASTATRYMTQGSDQLGYVLYQNPQRTTLWGDDEGNNTLSDVGTGVAKTIDVFARIPMQQTAPAGDYTDTIVVTVTW